MLTHNALFLQVPVSIFDGGAFIERHLYHLPLSREWNAVEPLRHALAIYRMVFGQPRQEDLLFSLSQSGSYTSGHLSDWLISLEPPILE